MRKGILVLAMVFAITTLSLTSDQSVAYCEDCQDVRWTCGEASASIYNACVSGGGSVANCAADEKTWYRMCVTANGCTEKID